MKIRFPSILLCATAVFLAAILLAQPPATYDFILTGAHIVDGTGAPWVAGDLAIQSDRIAAIGDLRNASATKRVDVSGLVVNRNSTF